VPDAPVAETLRRSGKIAEGLEMALVIDAQEPERHGGATEYRNW
jgi:hypothetical protein